MRAATAASTSSSASVVVASTTWPTRASSRRRRHRSRSEMPPIVASALPGRRVDPNLAWSTMPALACVMRPPRRRAAPRPATATSGATPAGRSPFRSWSSTDRRGTRPIDGSSASPRASASSIDGKSAPAAIVSAMPPENRGLISKTTGVSPRMRHWMLTGPRNGMASTTRAASDTRHGSLTVRPRSETPDRITMRSRGTIERAFPRSSHSTSIVYSGP